MDQNNLPAQPKKQAASPRRTKWIILIVIGVIVGVGAIAALAMWLLSSKPQLAAADRNVFLNDTYINGVEELSLQGQATRLLGASQDRSMVATVVKEKVGKASELQIYHTADKRLAHKKPVVTCSGTFPNNFVYCYVLADQGKTNKVELQAIDITTGKTAFSTDLSLIKAKPYFNGQLHALGSAQHKDFLELPTVGVLRESYKRHIIAINTEKKDGSIAWQETVASEGCNLVAKDSAIICVGVIPPKDQPQRPSAQPKPKVVSVLDINGAKKVDHHQAKSDSVIVTRDGWIEEEKDSSATGISISMNKNSKKTHDIYNLEGKKTGETGLDITLKIRPAPGAPSNIDYIKNALYDTATLTSPLPNKATTVIVDASGKTVLTRELSKDYSEDVYSTPGGATAFALKEIDGLTVRGVSSDGRVILVASNRAGNSSVKLLRTKDGTPLFEETPDDSPSVIVRDGIVAIGTYKSPSSHLKILLPKK